MATNFPNHHNLTQIRENVAQMTKKLVEWQNPNDGGWSASPGLPRPTFRSDVWTTAQAILWMTHLDAAAYRQSIGRGIAFLRSIQRTPENFGHEAADGGWGWKRGDVSDSAATSLSVLAILNFLRKNNDPIGSHLDSLRAGRDWMLNGIEPSGGVSNHPGNPPLAPNTCWVGTALAQCHATPDLDHPRISADLRRIVEFIKEKKNGGWSYFYNNNPDPLGTAYNIMLLQRLHNTGIITHEELMSLDASQWLKFNYQNDDGSWAATGSSYIVEATSWAVVAVLEGGSDSANSYRIWNAIDFLLKSRNTDLGWARTPEVNTENPAKVWVTIGALYALHSYLTSFPDTEE